jgi:hypothetical protein
VTILLRLCFCSSEIGPICSETCAAFGFHQCAILKEHRSARMCVKVDSRLMKAFGIAAA